MLHVPDGFNIIFLKNLAFFSFCILYSFTKLIKTCQCMQVDLVVFDGPKDDQAVSEEHMTLHKGVWSHQVSPALSSWNFQIMQQHAPIRLLLWGKSAVHQQSD